MLLFAIIVGILGLLLTLIGVFTKKNGLMTWGYVILVAALVLGCIGLKLENKMAYINKNQQVIIKQT